MFFIRHKEWKNGAYCGSKTGEITWYWKDVTCNFCLRYKPKESDLERRKSYYKPRVKKTPKEKLPTKPDIEKLRSYWNEKRKAKGSGDKHIAEVSSLQEFLY